VLIVRPLPPSPGMVCLRWSYRLWWVQTLNSNFTTTTCGSVLIVRPLTSSLGVVISVGLAYYSLPAPPTNIHHGTINHMVYYVYAVHTCTCYVVLVVQCLLYGSYPLLLGWLSSSALGVQTLNPRSYYY